MANKSIYNNFKAQMGAELESLAVLLNKNNVCGDVSPLYRAASMCRGSKSSSNNKMWMYEIDNLIFSFSQTPRHTYPPLSSNLNLELNVKVSGNFDHVDKIKDPLDTLEVNIVVTGTSAKKTNLICAWHLDRHVGESDSEYPHPTYHFHYGGKKINHNSHNFGEFLMMDSPRLCHFPLDGILAIDFVVSNYFPKHWNKLKLETQYLRIVKESQSRIWQPYAHTCAFKWQPFPSLIEWKPELLIPQLID